MIAKMHPASEGGSRIGIVFNGSPLFTGDAGGGESEIRRWIIENDWLEAVVALPEQLFYNTGISTYIWVLTNRKEPHRKGKVQLIDARNHWVPMEKSLGNKRRRIGDPSDKPKDPDYIGDITSLHGQFQDGASRWVLFDKDGKVVSVTPDAPTGDAPAGQQWKPLVVSKVFDNADFGYHKITVERPLRLSFHATPERIARLEDETAFKNLAASAKKDEAARLLDIAAGEKRQQQIRDLLAEFAKRHPEPISDRKVFLDRLKPVDREQQAQLFFAEVQNKLLYAVAGKTAAELVVARTDASQPNMALQSFSGSRVRKADVIVAKNYLDADEIDTLNRLVVTFLEQAETAQLDALAANVASAIDRLTEYRQALITSAVTGKIDVRDWRESGAAA